ncbi:MAG: arylsulfatase A [Algoriphagus sp.]|jgi:arylsulfatase A
MLVGLSSKLRPENKPTPPNIIVLFCDDLGYADLSSYGALWNRTPEIDQMATEGVRFTDFYAGAPVCTPSRAGLMTGFYVRRVDMDLDARNRWVLFPMASKGLNPQETTLAEALKMGGYSTAIIGKWHLEDQPEFLPIRHGFDYWFGLPYSNDMKNNQRKDPPLPLLWNGTVIEQLNEHKAFNQTTLTKRYTDEAIKQIGENKKKPFFLYLAHTMPHNPVAARQQFYAQTSNLKSGFGASVAEISWSTGEILNYIRNEGIANNTLVIFTSDNGGVPNFGASNGILKGRKGQTLEDGVRVPCIAWWPGKIKPGTTCNSPGSVIDFFATFTKIANIQLSDNVKRDGTDISSSFFNPEIKQKPRPYFYWHVGYLQAVRDSDWKLILQGTYSKEERENIKKACYGSTPTLDHIELFNLRKDPAEKVKVADKYPEIVSQISELTEKEKNALGEWTNKGKEVRKTVYIKNPKPLIK